MNNNPHITDQDLLAMAAEIDRLAFEDRGDKGLEARIFAATLPTLKNAAKADTLAPLRLVSDVPGPMVVVRRETRLAMRIAAGFAIAATAAIAWMGTHRPSSPGIPGQPMAVTASNSATEISVDEWAIASAVLDDGTNDEIDNLAKAASTLRTDLDTIGASETYEEAM